MAEARAQLVESWLESHLAGDDAVMMALTGSEVGALNDAARGAAASSEPTRCRRARGGGDRVRSWATRWCACATTDASGCSTARWAPSKALGMAVWLSRRPRGHATCRPRYLEDGHLAHGYALTVHKAQGLTVERAFVLADESLTQEAGYVAMSRARSGTELFVPVDASAEDPSGHDLRHQADDPMAARCATTGHVRCQATGLVRTRHERQSEPCGADRDVLDRSVYREGPQIGGGDETPSDDPLPAGDESSGSATGPR